MDTNRALTDPALNAARDLLADCSPRSPYRVLDWRSRLASFIADGGRPPRRSWIDPSVASAVRYIEYTERRRRRRPPRFATLSEAYRLRTGENRRLRDELELRILAGESYVDAAVKCGLSADAVKAYEQLYFNIADRLSSVDFIGAVVVGPSAYTWDCEKPFSTCIKLLVYRFGAPIVDHLVRYANGLDRAASEASLCQSTDSGLDAALQRLIKIMSMPITDATAPKLLRLTVVMRNLERDAASCPARSTSLALGVEDRLRAEALERAIETSVCKATSVTVAESGSAALTSPPGVVSAAVGSAVIGRAVAAAG
jgi:hypothetical protein